jgi:hypothetical protein
MIEAAIGKIAEELASVVVRTGARKLGRNFLGTPAERGMCKVYARAIASMLTEVKRITTSRAPAAVWATATPHTSPASTRGSSARRRRATRSGWREAARESAGL